MYRLAACFVLCLAGVADVSAAGRPMALNDMFAFKRVGDPQISPDGKSVVYQVGTIDLAANKSSTNLWVGDTDGKNPPRRLTTSTKADRHPRWSPDGTKILFESTRSGDSQLWVIDLTGGEARQLTTMSTGAGNALWSPDGKKIAFVSAVYPDFSDKPFAESDKLNKEKLDEVEKGPVKAKVFKGLFFRHWDEYVGDRRQHLFVIDAAGGEPKDVTPGDCDAYPTSTTFSSGDDFTFSPDGSHLVFTAVPDRDEAWSTNYDVCRVPVAGGKIETLTKDNLAADGSPRFSPDGKKIAWRAQKKAGYEADKWDLFVADCGADGALQGSPTNVTSKKDISAGDFVWHADGKTIFFTAEERANTVIWTSDIVEAEPKRFIEGGVVTALSISGDGTKVAMQSAGMDRPARVVVFGVAPGKNRQLQMIDPNAKLLAELDRPRPESVEVPVEGGVKMQMWVLKPPGFDPKLKWPVAFLVHGGPQGAWEDGWSNRWNPSLWAAQGYVVVLPNPRGSTGFGQKFVDEISGDWGGKCYRDLLAGLDYVAKLPYVDKDRMGAAGASFGGYMMDWFAVNDVAPRFQCIISHCSVWNFESMWGTTDELWFDEWEHQGLPWNKPGEYAKFSPHKKAGNLGKYKTPMLLIQNDLDFRCPVGQGLELFTALQRQHVPSKLINFPDEGHWVLKPKNSEYWHKEVFGWLKKYCPRVASDWKERSVIVLGLLAIPVLIFINGYFVAVEFALVSIRTTRVEELVQQRVRGARSLAAAKANMGRSIAAAQLGITLASIALGFVGESVLAKLLHQQLDFIPAGLEPITRHSIATVLSIAIITYVHVILGEQVPKIIAIQQADRLALATARSLNVFALVTSPVLRVMSWSGGLLLRALGYSSKDTHQSVASVEELQMLIEDTQEAGLMEDNQANLVRNVFKLTDKTVRDCMVPREKMDAIELRTPHKRVLDVVRRSGHTRLPVYEGEIDNICGILNTKNLFYSLTLGHVMVLDDALYPATFIDPDESIAIALQLFKKTRRPMAMVRDADKKVLGMLTLEDVLEEIVGDLEDEHDEGGPRATRKPGPGPGSQSGAAPK